MIRTFNQSRHEVAAEPELPWRGLRPGNGRVPPCFRRPRCPGGTGRIEPEPLDRV